MDIQIPDLETRLAILRAKAEQINRRFPNKVLEFIAGRVQRNVRELEGCLNIVAAHAGLGHESLNGHSEADVDLNLVEQALEDSLKESIRRVSEEDVLSAVARYFSIDKSTLKGKKRDRTTAQGAPRFDVPSSGRGAASSRDDWAGHGREGPHDGYPRLPADRAATGGGHSPSARPDEHPRIVRRVRPAAFCPLDCSTLCQYTPSRHTEN